MTSEETLAELERLLSEGWTLSPLVLRTYQVGVGGFAKEFDAASLIADSRELRRLRSSLSRLEQGLRAKAITSRQEADRIRRTIKEPTDAEARCLMRAEDWELVADALKALNSEVR